MFALINKHWSGGRVAGSTETAMLSPYINNFKFIGEADTINCELCIIVI